MATALLPVISPHVSAGMPLPALVLNAGNKTAWRFHGSLCKRFRKIGPQGSQAGESL